MPEPEFPCPWCGTMISVGAFDIFFYLQAPEPVSVVCPKGHREFGWQPSV